MIHDDNYPENTEDWIDVTEECRQDFLLPTQKANIPSRALYRFLWRKSDLETSQICKQTTLAINSVAMELHEHVNTVHGLKDLLLAQNRDMPVLVIKKLVAKESIDN